MTDTATVTQLQTPEQRRLAVLEALRAEFPPDAVGKLPKITCRSCSQDNRKVCNEHSKSECPTCGNYMTNRHIHLDYVGHAEVTDRLLTVDPEWNWEPVAFDANGMPAMTYDSQHRPVAMWVRLTVAGMTRLGVGTVLPGAFDAEKQLIGDALRNAAMRFGVALDLWAKEKLESTIPDSDVSNARFNNLEPDPPKPPPREWADPEVLAALYDRATAFDEGGKATLRSLWTADEQFAAYKPGVQIPADLVPTLRSWIEGIETTPPDQPAGATESRDAAPEPADQPAAKKTPQEAAKDAAKDVGIDPAIVDRVEAELKAMSDKEVGAYIDANGLGASGSKEQRRTRVMRAKLKAAIEEAKAGS